MTRTPRVRPHLRDPVSLPVTRSVYSLGVYLDPVLDDIQGSTPPSGPDPDETTPFTLQTNRFNVTPDVTSATHSPISLCASRTPPECRSLPLHPRNLGPLSTSGPVGPRLRLSSLVPTTSEPRPSRATGVVGTGRGGWVRGRSGSGRRGARVSHEDEDDRGGATTRSGSTLVMERLGYPNSTDFPNGAISQCKSPV